MSSFHLLPLSRPFERISIASMHQSRLLTVDFHKWISALAKFILSFTGGGFLRYMGNIFIYCNLQISEAMCFSVCEV